jgi:hypothetical protein
MVGSGSGCIFQPMTTDYSYILTAKHLFFDEIDNERGMTEINEKPDNTLITITKNIQIQNGWSEEQIPFELIKNENYFPHAAADCAILKIPLQINFEQIVIEDFSETDVGFELCGFPSTFRVNEVGEKYTTRVIERFISSGNYCHGAQLFGTLNQTNIEGMSGCGLLKISGDYISITGIQSKMASQSLSTGQIGFVPIKYIREIIGYGENQNKLAKLYPIYMRNFSFLREESFKLEVDAIDEDKISGARTTLRNKALNIISSDMTPLGIKELFKDRLLINEKESDSLSHRFVWIAWLEFLTIMNIVKYDPLNAGLLSEIFDSYRLKCTNIDDWTKLIPSELAKSDYLGLKAGATVIVSSKSTPKTTFRIPQGTMINIARVYDKDGFRTDKGIDPFTSFNFIHLDYFKTKCILEKMGEYQNLNEDLLIEKLKQEYHELFN